MYVILVILIDIALLLSGIYLNESASRGIVKYMPIQFSKDGSYRWYIQHFAFEKNIDKKCRLKYLISIYIFSAFILSLSVTMYIFDQVVPGAIFMVMSVASLYGLVMFTRRYRRSLK